MKPLSSYTYIKSNPRKVLPSYGCTVISVFLIYLLGLLLYGSIADFYKLSVNVVSKGTMVYSNDINHPIREDILQTIGRDANVKAKIPFLGMSNGFNYQAVFGGSGSSAVIVYSADVRRILKNFNIELTSGTIPRDNASEILLPLEFTRQYGLKLGDYLDNKTNPSMTLNRTYRLVGITKGNVWLPIVCDVGTVKRSEAAKFGMLVFFKNANNKALNDKLHSTQDKHLVLQEYGSTKRQMNQAVSSITFLYVTLVVIILIVLSISLSNLNYIVFLNRRNEFAILATIGFSKSKLRKKLFTENALVCLLGYVFGIAFTMLIIQLLNIGVWQAKGQHIPIFRLDSMLVSLIVPIAVSLLSMISSIQEFNKLSYESLTA